MARVNDALDEADAELDEVNMMQPSPSIADFAETHIIPGVTVDVDENAPLPEVNAPEFDDNENVNDVLVTTTGLEV